MSQRQARGLDRTNTCVSRVTAESFRDLLGFSVKTTDPWISSGFFYASVSGQRELKGLFRCCFCTDRLQVLRARLVWAGG